MKYLSFNHILVFALLCIAALLRTYQIGEYPLTINQDELNNIYDGWSFAETGKDRWETPNPFVLKGLGNNDYRQSGEAWLCAIVFKIFGYSVPAGRYLSSFLGLCSLLILFLFCKKTRNESFAILALIVAVFSPFHIQMSRMAHEGTILPPFFLISILYLWLLAREKKYTTAYTILLGLLTGLSVNTYRSMYVIAPLLVLLVLFDLIRSKAQIKTTLFFLVMSLVGAFPQLYAIATLPEHIFERAGNVMMKPLGPLDYVASVIGNMWKNIAPVFLFFDFGNYNNLTAMRELPFEVIPFYSGIFILIFKKQFLKTLPQEYFIVILLICLAPAAISTMNPHALRASVLCVMIPVIVACAYDVLIVYKPAWTKIIVMVLLSLHAICFAYYAKKYMGDDIMRNNAHQHEMVKLSKWLALRHRAYDTIYIDNKYNSEYLYIMAFVPIDPKTFQTGSKTYTSGEWVKFSRIGKFMFTNIDSLKKLYENDRSKSHLYVSFQAMGTAFDSIGNVHDKTYFTIPPQLLRKANGDD